MRERFVLIAVLLVSMCFSFGCTNSNDDVKTEIQINEEKNEIIEETSSIKAEITYATQKPIIDGERDECWDNADKLYTEGHILQINASDDVIQNKGYVSLLWDENNLYLLGVVDDVDITKYDRINFWIAETYIEPNEVVPYTSDPSVGNYYSIVTPHNEQLLYESTEGKPVDFINDIKGYECKTTRLIGETGDHVGYIVEMKIPKQSYADWKEGHLLGFDVSIDTYFSGETTRATYNDESMYCYWNGAGKYWEYASALGCLRFVKE